MEGRQPKGLALARIPTLLPLSRTEHRAHLAEFSGDGHDCETFCRVSAPIEPKAVLGQRLRDWKMVRTIWLAAICLAVLGAMAVGNVLKAPATPAIHETPADGATVDGGLTQEPLPKSDRLQIINMRQEALPEFGLQPIEPSVPEVQNSVSLEAPIIVNRHWHDPYDTNSAMAKSKQLGRTVR